MTTRVADAPEPPLDINGQLRAFLRRRARIDNALCCYDLADDAVRAQCAPYASVLKQILLGNVPPTHKD